MKPQIIFLFDEGKFAIADGAAANPAAPINDKRYDSALTALCDIVLFAVSHE